MTSAKNVAPMYLPHKTAMYGTEEHQKYFVEIDGDIGAETVIKALLLKCTARHFSAFCLGRRRNKFKENDAIILCFSNLRNVKVVSYYSRCMNYSTIFQIYFTHMLF